MEKNYEGLTVIPSLIFKIVVLTNKEILTSLLGFFTFSIKKANRSQSWSEEIPTMTEPKFALFPKNLLHLLQQLNLHKLIEGFEFRIALNFLT